MRGMSKAHRGIRVGLSVFLGVDICHYDENKNLKQIYINHLFILNSAKSRIFERTISIFTSEKLHFVFEYYYNKKSNSNSCQQKKIQ